MTRRTFLAGAATALTMRAADDWREQADAIVARIQLPKFPNRDFEISKYGARPGVDASDAIRKAIDACSAACGGRVVVPREQYVREPVHTPVLLPGQGCSLPPACPDDPVQTCSGHNPLQQRESLGRLDLCPGRPARGCSTVPACPDAPARASVPESMPPAQQRDRVRGSARVLVGEGQVAQRCQRVRMVDAAGPVPRPASTRSSSGTASPSRPASR